MREYLGLLRFGTAKHYSNQPKIQAKQVKIQTHTLCSTSQAVGCGWKIDSSFCNSLEMSKYLQREDNRVTYDLTTSGFETLMHVS